MKHNVFIWLKQNHKGKDDLILLEEKLQVLTSNKHVDSATWGRSAETPNRDVTHNDFHVGITIDFFSVQGHDAFQISAEHEDFVSSCGHMFEKVMVFDVK